MNKYLYFLILLSFSTVKLKAQTLPVGLLENVEDEYRRRQLLGKDSTNGSYMIRPINLRGDHNLHLLYENDKVGAKIYALPVVWQQQYNTHHPYGMNDGSMIPAKGYQTQVSAGLYAKLGPLSIQLRPEFVYAENKKFEEIQDNKNAFDIKDRYAAFFNGIDLPTRFGEQAYSKLSWGQSSIKLTFDPVSFGISNENLWWGPGLRSSLLMSNEAPGFKHLTLNTSKPVDTYIGSFEAQIVGGRLEASGVPLPDDKRFKPKPDDWRYFSGVAFAYQPKWLPNLYLGFNRSFIVYHKDMGSGFGDYFPFFSSLEKSSFEKEEGDNLEDQSKRDQYISFYGRWVMPESKAEVYLEYGRNDHSYNARDFLVQPEHSRAYVAGFRKLISLTQPDTYLQLGIEFTQLEMTQTKSLRISPPWYKHYQVKDGYTHNGQVLGAGVGPGGNLQTLDLTWVNGLKRIGLQIERQVHNNDLLYSAAPYTADFRRHWVDYGFTGKLDWDFGKWVLSSRLAYIRSLNYQYQFGVRPDGDTWNWYKQDVNNFQLKLGVLYNW